MSTNNIIILRQYPTTRLITYNAVIYLKKCFENVNVLYFIVELIQTEFRTFMENVSKNNKNFGIVAFPK